MAKTIIKESQLRQIIKESIKVALNENWWYDEEHDDTYENDVDVPEYESTVTIYYNPQTLEPCKNGESDSYIVIKSKDFPEAWVREIPGDRWTAPDADGDSGPCGGNFEIWDGKVPDELEDKQEEIEQAFIDKNREYILQCLTDYAEPC